MTRLGQGELIVRSKSPKTYFEGSLYKGQLYLDTTAGRAYRADSAGKNAVWIEVHIPSREEWEALVEGGIVPGTGVPPTDEGNQVYGTDNTGDQTTYEISTGASLEETVLQRTVQGSAHALTLEDSDENSSPNDLINRQFAERFRGDRVAHIVVADGSSRNIDTTDDVTIFIGDDISEYSIHLPDISEYKRVLLAFNVNVEALALVAHDDDAVDYYPAKVGAGDVFEWGYDWNSGLWTITTIASSALFTREQREYIDSFFGSSWTAPNYPTEELPDPPEDGQIAFDSTQKVIVVGVDGAWVPLGPGVF